MSPLCPPVGSGSRGEPWYSLQHRWAHATEIRGIRSHFGVPAFCVAWIPTTRPLEEMLFLLPNVPVPPTDQVPVSYPEFPLAH